MFQKIVPLNENEFIVVEWLEGWRDLTIKMDGVLLGTVPGELELKGGRNFPLPNGKSVMLVLADYGLEVWCDGKELVSGTKSGGVDNFGTAFNSLFSVGTVNLFIAAFVFIVADTEFMRYLDIAIACVGGGMIFLGFYARDASINSPYWIGLVIGAINFVLMLLLRNYIGIAASVYLVTSMRKGINSSPYQPTRKITIDEDGPLDSGM